MRQTVYITGHKNPDTDSICSAIAYSYLKQQIGINAQAVKLGSINTETQYILNRFNFDTPRTFYNIKPTIKDIDFDDAILVLEDEPIKDVYKKLLVNNKAVAAVVKVDGELVGVVSLSDITHALLSLSRQEYNLFASASFENIVKAVDGVAIYNSGFYQPSGVVSIASSVLGDLTEDEFKNRIAITSTRVSTQINAILAKVTMVISTSSEGFEEEVIELAKKHKTNLVATKKDLIAVAQNISSAISCKEIMTQRKVVTFSLYDYVDDVRERINKSRHRAYPIVDRQNRVMGFISRYHVLNARRKKLILLDHQEANQSIDGVAEADILEIIDHHKLGDIKTNRPIYFRNEICGATSTIISQLFEENSIEIPKDYASILLSAIISDTMNFHSPTTKIKDRRQAEMLADIAEVDIEELAYDILKVSASISKKTADEIITNDMKLFSLSSYKIAIGQINTLDKSEVLKVKKNVESEYRDYIENKGADLGILLFTLIDGKGSYMITVGENKDLLNQAFEKVAKEEDGILYLPKVMSRKQQVIPIISHNL